MKIINAFKRTTKKGHNVFRIEIDTEEVLNHLEQNRKRICYDIICAGGMVKTIKGKSKKNGKPYEALQYYVWAKEDSNGNRMSEVRK